MSVKLDHHGLKDITYLYHINVKVDENLKKDYQDVKFVFMGGKQNRMRQFANLMYEKLGRPKNSIFEETTESSNPKLKDLGEAANRYSVFKVGPVISASHGIGSASTSVVLHELLILAYFAECRDITFCRLGTSGGLGLTPGTVVITKQAYTGLLEPYFKQKACGREYKYEAKSSPELIEKILACAKSIDVPAMIGNTMGTDDFYEEQGRCDGALCSFTEDDKKSFLKRAHDECGIKNFEMESPCFLAMCNRAKVKCAVICCTVINRLQGDTILAEPPVLKEWESYMQRIAVEFVLQNMKN